MTTRRDFIKTSGFLVVGLTTMPLDWVARFRNVLLIRPAGLFGQRGAETLGV